MKDNKTFFWKAEQSQLTFHDIFSDVFRHHTPEENARLFLAGTAMTTPDESSMLAKWMKPYMFARVFAFGMAVFVAAVLMMTQVSLVIPFAFVEGSFLMPVVMMLLFWEMNVPRNVSLPTLILIFMGGGVIALMVLTVLLNFYIESSNFANIMCVGFAEEAVKVLAAAIWLRDKDKKYILTGMLVGSAVGAGFAAIESTGYAIVRGNWSIFTLILRALLAPGGHVTWAAITGGALVWAKGDESLSVKHLVDPVFLAGFAFCMLTHFLWDYIPWFCFIDIFLILAAAYWLMKKGVNQVVNASLSANQGRMTIALDHDPLAGMKAGMSAGASDMFQSWSGSTEPAWALCPVSGDSSLRIQGIRGTFAGRRFRLDSVVRIGRDPARCDLVMSSSATKISGLHCQIEYREGKCLIQDLHSTNGTFINGSRLAPGQILEIRVGDRIFLGSPDEELQITMPGGRT